MELYYCEECGAIVKPEEGKGNDAAVEQDADAESGKEAGERLLCDKCSGKEKEHKQSKPGMKTSLKDWEQVNLFSPKTIALKKEQMVKGALIPKIKPNSPHLRLVPREQEEE